MTTIQAGRLAQVAASFIAVDDIRSPYLHAGPSDAAEAVVFLHGNPGPAEDWRRLISRAGTFARAIAPDMPGYGGADKPDRFVYTVDGYARHLAGVLDQLGVQRVHLVLHDFGGLWGLAWAADHPDRFASVTLIDIGVLCDYRWHYVARIWRTSGLGEAFMRTTPLRVARLLLRHGNRRGPPLDVASASTATSKTPPFNAPSSGCTAPRRLRATSPAVAAHQPARARGVGAPRPICPRSLW